MDKIMAFPSTQLQVFLTVKILRKVERTIWWKMWWKIRRKIRRTVCRTLNNVFWCIRSDVFSFLHPCNYFLVYSHAVRNFFVKFLSIWNSFWSLLKGERAYSELLLMCSVRNRYHILLILVRVLYPSKELVRRQLITAVVLAAMSSYGATGKGKGKNSGGKGKGAAGHLCAQLRHITLVASSEQCQLLINSVKRRHVWEASVLQS